MSEKQCHAHIDTYNDTAAQGEGFFDDIVSLPFLNFQSRLYPYVLLLDVIIFRTITFIYINKVSKFFFFCGKIWVSFYSNSLHLSKLNIYLQL